MPIRNMVFYYYRNEKAGGFNMGIATVLLVYLIFFAVLIGQGCVWGWAVNKVVKNRGYDENWFWWGFFFGLIALIVALTKPQNTYGQYKSTVACENGTNSDKFAEVKKYKELMDAGIITEEEFSKKKSEILGV